MKKALKFFLCLIYLFLTTNVFTLNLGIIDDSSSIPIAYMLLKNNEQNNQIEYRLFNEPKSIVKDLIKKNIDIAIIPADLAYKINETNADFLSILAVLQNKVDYILKWEEQVPYEIYSSQIQDIPKFLNKSIKVIILPEPYVSIINSKVFLDFEPVKVDSDIEDVPKTFIVARSEFLLENKNDVEIFLQKYENSFHYTLNSPYEAGILCKQLGLSLNERVIISSIPQQAFIFKRLQEN